MNKFRFIKLNLFFLAIFFLLFFGVIEISLAESEPPFIDDDFVLFWENPTRAYPGIPLDFRFIAYEKDNQILTWQLFGAPSGMTIDNEGKVLWTPTVMQQGEHTITVRVSRSVNDYIERDFILTVDTEDFIFVSPFGSDTFDGSLSAPFATIEHAMRSIQNGDGKTIYLRGGTYFEHYSWETGGIISPWRERHFSAQDPVEIRSYPGEWAILDCELQGHGFWAFQTSYIVFDNLEVKNASSGERGGIMISDSEYVVVRDTVVHDSHWSHTTNCTGYLLQGSNDVVFDGTVGYDNYDPNSTHHNSSNYLVYTEAPASGSLYILNSESYGSIVGFKTKHAGPAKLILHNNISHNESSGFNVGSDYSSVRYSIVYNVQVGVNAGITDPNSYTQHRVLIDHNTIVNAQSSGIYFEQGFFTLAPSIIRNNIIYNNLSPAGTGESDDRLMGFWYYDDNAEAYSLISDQNLFYSLSENNIVRYGHSDYNYSFSSWKTKGYDINSIFADPVFSDFADNNFQPNQISLACDAASDGGDIGALTCNDDLSDLVSPTAPIGLNVI